MSRHVAIVTDSTAYLPPRTMERHGITSVPLTVVLGDRALEEGTEISARSLAEALQKRRPVTTSRPSPQVFAETYREVAGTGATDIVSLHLSSEFSGTYDAAVLAAREAPVPVRVVDTGMVAMALGFCALAAAETAEAGGTVDEAVTAAEKRAAGTSAFFYVDTLDYLRRGGRIGAAQALFGSALAVKPLLQLDDGRIDLLEKVRTASRAIARLEEIVAERAMRRAGRHRGAPSRRARAGGGARRAAADEGTGPRGAARERGRRGDRGAYGAGVAGCGRLAPLMWCRWCRWCRCVGVNVVWCESPLWVTEISTTGE